MDRELEYIKLKVDWYKSIYPWYVAILAGQVAFLRTIDVEEGGGEVYVLYNCCKYIVYFFSIGVRLASIIASNP
ncbi:hypothetical protein [Vreelandella neptunia]|uniref:Uncharacterized protein n=1 Tax=Vreelandella neptunia TaxID=115551 RepID=A0ABS9S533_9GAMM|nr:hypothetical protein [Halomonas neptunia]MCH4811205.1 hypothetical protein [Halomonas neptunia]